MKRHALSAIDMPSLARQNHGGFVLGTNAQLSDRVKSAFLPTILCKFFNPDLHGSVPAHLPFHLRDLILELFDVILLFLQMLANLERTGIDRVLIGWLRRTFIL